MDKMSPACSPVCPGISRPMLFVLLLSGLCSCLHRYHLIEELKTWWEAQQYCREKYKDLATIDNMEDMAQLIAAAGSYEGEVWIGLHDRPLSWTWSLQDSSFYGDTGRIFRMWSDGSPHTMENIQWLCVAFQEGVWKDHNCHEKYPFVCYNKTVEDAEQTFFEARSYCRNHHSDLASVRNHTENSRIQEAVPKRQQAWLGLHRGSWIWWSDNAPYLFGNWAEGHPLNINNSCAASVINATHPGKWVEKPCHEKLNFMCYNDKTQLFTIKLTALKSTIDLSDQAVTDAILNLVEEKMKEKGITRDFKISWIKKQNKDIFHKVKATVDLVKTDL
ncbi:macrophage mannose receptor 1-like isoform X2 [Chelmon rostratus]|uniref:macrophage mannose receptor 1-like isoform X2 n=1 Tax=Chelmon rostratus TaxID=109905 RepID=UPI001BE8785B|nr:macrophage mannose receptor 1-like isoform X2 [Chelmon rostratus]